MSPAKGKSPTKKTGIHVLDTSVSGTKITKTREKKKSRKTDQRILANIEADKYETKQINCLNYRSIKLFVTDRIFDRREQDLEKKKLGHRVGNKYAKT